MLIIINSISSHCLASLVCVSFRPYFSSRTCRFRKHCQTRKIFFGATSTLCVWNKDGDFKLWRKVVLGNLIVLVSFCHCSVLEIFFLWVNHYWWAVPRKRIELSSVCLWGKRWNQHHSSAYIIIKKLVKVCYK